MQSAMACRVLWGAECYGVSAMGVFSAQNPVREQRSHKNIHLSSNFLLLLLFSSIVDM